MSRTPNPNVDRRLDDPARMHHLVAEVYTERRRAHDKHGDNSVEAADSPFDPRLLPIMLEEAGEVARELNDAGWSAHRDDDVVTVVHLARLRAELVQLAAMTVAWIDHVDLAATDRLLTQGAHA